MWEGHFEKRHVFSAEEHAAQTMDNTSSCEDAYVRSIIASLTSLKSNTNHLYFLNLQKISSYL